jgi:hypothetical protein
MKLRFTIRDLLWLALVVAMAVGWWLNNRQMANTIARLQSSAAFVSISDDSVEKAMRMDAREF